MRSGICVSWIHIYSGRSRSDIRKKSLISAVEKLALGSETVALSSTIMVSRDAVLAETAPV